MKIKNLMLAMMLVLSLTAVAWGQSSMSLDHVDGLWGTSTDTVNVDELITFHIRMTNNSGGNITGHTTAFRVYSPTGSEWNTTAGAFTGAITTAMYDAPLQYNEFSITGSGSDTVGFGGFRMGP